MNYDKVAKLKSNAEKLSSSAATIRKNFRADGYKNMLNKYGTAQDNSTAYYYEPDGRIVDMELTAQYESNGLFAKIIDTPAEECFRTGYDFTFDDLTLKKRIQKRLIDLEFDEKATQAIKWARLYGGSLMVLLLDDGGELDEPVNWENVKNIDEILVFERAIVQPDYTSLYQHYGDYFTAHKKSKFGQPQYYYVSSINGFFIVHESRCIAFKNGVMPQFTLAAEYRFWGIPEYLRWKRELKDTSTTHGNASKLLERSVQAVYKMKDLAQLLATDEGEEAALTRLQLIDMARGFLNTVAIDGEGEDYSFQTFTLSGVKEVVDTTCQMLSAVTEIPQAILFGRSPAGMNSTGDADLENYYNFVNRIRSRMVKGALEKVVDVLMLVDAHKGKIDTIPEFDVEFESLWSLNEKEQNEVDSQKAQIAQTKAQTAEMYINMGALDPSEVRKGLMQSDEYEIEELVDENDELDILSPEERTALVQMKMQDAGGGTQEQGMQGMEGMMQGNLPPEMSEGEMGGSDALQGIPEEKHDSEDFIEGDGLIIRNGVAYIDVGKLGSIGKRKDKENLADPLTMLQKCSTLNTDGVVYKLKDGERWVTWRGHHIVVDKDGNLVWGSETARKAFESSESSKSEVTKAIEDKSKEHEGAGKSKHASKFAVPNRFAKGKLTEHHTKHVKKFGEFGNITEEEYMKRAIEATKVDLDSPDIEHFIANLSDNGERRTGDEREVIIYNKKDGTYVKFVPAWKIVITYFKPAFNSKTKSQDKNEAYKYYLETKERNEGKNE